jgi:multidrug efflux pump
MAILMLAILIIHLQTFSRLALVFVTAPLGLIGTTRPAARPAQRLR